MELGAIGELVGGAVLATLVYLALQVRTGTGQARQTAASARIAATQAIHTNYNHSVALLVGNDSIVAVDAMMNEDVHSLTHQQRFRWGSQLYTMYCHFEMVYFLRKQGLVEPDEVNRATALLGSFQSAPGVRDWWHPPQQIAREFRLQNPAPGRVPRFRSMIRG